MNYECYHPDYLGASSQIICFLNQLINVYSMENEDKHLNNLMIFLLANTIYELLTVLIQIIMGPLVNTKAYCI